MSRRDSNLPVVVAVSYGPPAAHDAASSRAGRAASDRPLWRRALMWREGNHCPLAPRWYTTECLAGSLYQEERRGRALTPSAPPKSVAGVSCRLAPARLYTLWLARPRSGFRRRTRERPRARRPKYPPVGSSWLCRSREHRAPSVLPMAHIAAPGASRDCDGEPAGLTLKDHGRDRTLKGLPLTAVVAAR